jgi:hypothetical protein
MYAANAYTIRQARETDVNALHRLAELDSEPRPLTGRIIVGEVKGEIAAAIAVDDGRLIADPFRPTAQLAAHLRRRRSAMRAVDHQPSLRERMLTGLAPRQQVGDVA